MERDSWYNEEGKAGKKPTIGGYRLEESSVF